MSGVTTPPTVDDGIGPPGSRATGVEESAARMFQVSVSPSGERVRYTMPAGDADRPPASGGFTSMFGWRVISPGTAARAGRTTATETAQTSMPRKVLGERIAADYAHCLRPS